MIIDFNLSPRYLPSERAVWLMSKAAEKDGVKVDLNLMRAFERGEMKYVDHTMYKLCRHCMEYKTLDNFYTNKRYVGQKGYICKPCYNTRMRIKKYGTVGFISDSGMQSTSEGFGMNLSENMREILKRRLIDEDNIDRKNAD